MAAAASSSTLAPPSANGQPASTGSTKEQFNQALQSRNPENNYIAHLKIWETTDDGQRKARYLILAVQRDTGKVTLNKAKRNANGSFSIGKDWDLNTLREAEVHGPDSFSITLSRSYKWQTERPREQLLFLQSLVKVFRKYTRESGPRCIGFDVPLGSAPSSSTATPPNLSSSEARRPSVSKQSSPTLKLDTSSVRPPQGQVSPSLQPPRSPLAARSPTFSRSPSTLEPEKSRSSSRPSFERRPSETGLAPVSDPISPATDRSGASLLAARPSMSRGASSQSVGRLSPLPPPDLAVPTENGSRTRTDSSISAASDQLLGRSPSRASSRREGMSAVSNEVNGRDSPSRTSQSHRRQASELKPSSPSKELALAPPTVNGLGRSATARERYKERSGSGDSLSTGDARARLSAVEPVRGGAAYERMLLAGTGLTGVGEADEDEEDEDPYGGAVLGDGEAENAPAAAKRQSVARPRNVKLDSAERIRGVAEDGAGTSEIDEEEDTTLLNVEEMLEGFEWRSAGSSGGKALADGTRRTGGRGTADVIEARLLDELQALEAANIHAIIESDDRVALVVKHLDEALAQLDSMDSMMGAFKVQLNARADDISHIESQNRGLQVQTSNQRTLATEIEKLLATIHVDESELTALNRASLESPAGIEQLESAASTLYKSMLQARRDDGGADMAAATERLDEYMQVSAQFCKRLLDYLSMAFRYQADALLSDPARQAAASPPTPYLRDHSPMEDFLGRYCGLLLYMKEIDDKCFARLSAAYFASASELYKTEMQRIFAVYKGQVRKATDEDAEASFVLPAQTAASALRSGTIRRAGMGRGDRTNRDRRGQGEVTGNEAFQRLLSQIMPLVIREQSFIADFLHINDNAVTFADYMDLEPYFRRRAAALFAYSTSGPLREIKGALDLIFGFLAPEWQAFTDLALQRDKIQIVGILAALDRAIVEAEELNNEFLLRSLSKLHMRLASQLERFVGEQIKGIEQTKLTVKKRKGVAHFIKVFPIFVDRVESQLLNAETLNIRTAVDGYYEQISRTMFDALQAMAKMDGGAVDEDKGQLNHHVILIENMHHFTTEVSRQRNPALSPLVKRAESIYLDSLASYVHFVLRRPLGKMLDFCDGIDSLLKSTPANEVSLHNAYSKSALKRLTKEYSSKDVRKAIEALSKRVQKHFGDDEESGGGALLGGGSSSSGLGLGGGGGSGGGGAGTDAHDEAEEVMARVWAACEDAFVKETERLSRIVKECYPDGAAQVEYEVADVRKPFSANNPSSAGRRR